jgi:membrane protein implicated in regulation of membrane protease activity
MVATAFLARSHQLVAVLVGIMPKILAILAVRVAVAVVVFLVLVRAALERVDKETTAATVFNQQEHLLAVVVVVRVQQALPLLQMLVEMAVLVRRQALQVLQ